MFDFNSLLGNPTAEDAREMDLGAGFTEGVLLAKRLVEVIAENTVDKSPAYIEGLFLALREEL